MQINVVDAETLREAQKHPEQYENLVVRIGGFSTYFNWLSHAHQDDIDQPVTDPCEFLAITCTPGRYYRQNEHMLA